MTITFITFLSLNNTCLCAHVDIWARGINNLNKIVPFKIFPASFLPSLFFSSFLLLVLMWFNLSAAGALMCCLSEANQTWSLRLCQGDLSLDTGLY